MSRNRCLCLCLGGTPGSHSRNLEVPRNPGWKTLVEIYKEWDLLLLFQSNQAFMLVHSFICESSRSSWLKTPKSLKTIHICLLFRVCFILTWNKNTAFQFGLSKRCKDFLGSYRWNKLGEITIEIISEKSIIFQTISKTCTTTHLFFSPEVLKLFIVLSAWLGKLMLFWM